MKKLKLTIAFFLFSMGAYAQTNVFPLSGNVGIGTNNPTRKLHVYHNEPDQTGLIIQGNTINTDNAGHYVGITLDGDYGDATGNNSQIRSYSNLHNFWGSSLTFYTTSNSAPFGVLERLRINASGNVSIGTADPKGYKLAVAGSMIAESVKVKLQGAWPDNVFAKSYILPTLQETEAHIKEQGHLPGIPSAEEVKTNGVDLGDMNAKLLQKIEELTLYIINQDQRISKLEKSKKVRRNRNYL